ncbi:sodium/proline symporter [Crocosphaera chwakensis]|uniref:Sodium/proline symporter n=1 Tax=Crocosphaera chwakensis CCY0110 TaxID=391612 RepID=A3ILG3_9CHRO|nr:sodium/proline symporter [Crocosphaera chwakensis]EAZ92614.1 sodium solute transporter family protein [Crocosphaera chwakensis CCY0110]
MVDQIGIIITFIFFLLLFTGVGTYSATQKKATTTDYLLASRQVNPWLTALSAMATGQSGLLFIGQVGFAYNIGISAMWLIIGWAIGDYLAWLFVFQPLREQSEATASDTVSSFLSKNIKGYRLIALFSAIITIIFLGSYAAAQLVAGSKALNAVFGWNYNLGIIVGAIIVVIYCFSGGIRASIWTDALQGILMFGSLLILLAIAIIKCGGFSTLWASLNQIDPNLTNFSPQSLPLGFIPFLIGWIVAGFGVVGQPHIMVRAMAINSSKNIAFARNLKLSLGLTNSFSALGIGLTARVLLPELLTSGDPELALPYLSLELLPVVLVGLILAGLFSATMSTADSQILSCSAALTQDVFPGMSQSYNFAKIGTLTVTAVILVMALVGDNNVFALVTFAWSALASGLGPLLLVKVWQQPISTVTAIAMMVIGIATALIWNLVFNLSDIVYEVLPGMVAGMAVYAVYWFVREQKKVT